VVRYDIKEISAAPFVAAEVDECSSHASATATCEQIRPKHGEGKDQASVTYK